MDNYIKWSERLTYWRKTRGLDMAIQQDGYIRNIMEELGELATAIIEYDEDGKIDALCDILVFSLNCLENVEQLKIPTVPSEYGYSQLLKLISVYETNGYMLEDFLPILALIKKEVNNLGYDLDIAMDETIKEISSRKGSYNSKLKKWVKDCSEEAKAKWYKADYRNAKLRGK